MTGGAVRRMTRVNAAARQWREVLAHSEAGPVGGFDIGAINVYIGQENQKSAGRTSPSLPSFVFGNGYALTAYDLGSGGVKIELDHIGDVGAAIILPPEEVGNLGRWLLQTLGQDKHGLPVEIGGILERLSKAPAKLPMLERGDKKHIKEALRALRS